MPHIVVALPGNEQLALALAQQTNGHLVQLEFRHFPDGETYLRVQGDVRGKTAVVACGLDRPNEKAVGLLLLSSTLRDLGASQIIVAAPYLGYMRQDRVFHQGEGVSARYFAQFLSQIADGLVTVDPHLHRIHKLSEVFSIPTRVATASTAMSNWIKANIPAPVVIGPDSESEQWASAIAHAAGCPYTVLQKTRLGDRSVQVSIPDPTLMRDRTPVLIDDIISTAKTMIAAIEHVVAGGFEPPVCLGVHGVFAGSAYQELLASGTKRIVTCNTVPHESNNIDVHDAVASAVSALLKGPA